MSTWREELLKKVNSLEASNAELREEVSNLMIADESPPPPPPPQTEFQLEERHYLNVLESMGRSLHIFHPDGRIFYWKRSAENLYGYSATEAIGRTIYELIVSNQDLPIAKAIIQRCCMGETWTGKFPVTHKMGLKFPIFVTNTPLYDDDGTFIGIICLACDARQFKDIPVSLSDPVEEVMGRDFSRPRSSVMTRFGLDPDPPLQTAIASKITNLASKVSNKVRSKMKIEESNVFRDRECRDSRLSDVVLSELREDGNSSGDGTPTGAGKPAGVFGSFTTGKPAEDVIVDAIDDGERSPGIHKMMNKKACDYGRHVANEASGTCSSSFIVNSNSSATHKLDVEADCLNYEIMWEDLTVGEQIGQGSCGTVYHGLWHGSDVAIKVFSKQEYSEEVILSFKQEVSLMKRLRHPNILLYMGAVTSPQHLCIVTEFLPRGSLFRLLQRSTSKLDWRRKLQIALDIARGMNYLHNYNPPIVHRDLKSSNLLVDKNWSVKVADFGLSRLKHETYLTTNTGKGTPQWMAPEVIQNERSNEKSDLYSFGVVLWELATQKIPWENLNAMQVIGAVGFMNRRLDIPEDIDPEWASMIESCWGSDPQSRPTFQELLAKLKGMQKQYAVQSQAVRSASAAALPPKQV